MANMENEGVTFESDKSLVKYLNFIYLFVSSLILTFYFKKKTKEINF